LRYTADRQTENKGRNITPAQVKTACTWKRTVSSKVLLATDTRDRRAVTIYNKKLSWCWQTRATRLQVSQGHQTWHHSIC